MSNSVSSNTDYRLGYRDGFKDASDLHGSAVSALRRLAAALVRQGHFKTSRDALTNYGLSNDLIAIVCRDHS